MPQRVVTQLGEARVAAMRQADASPLSDTATLVAPSPTLTAGDEAWGKASLWALWNSGPQSTKT